MTQIASASSIPRKSRHDIAQMRVAGRIVAEVHALIREHLKPGVSTLDLDELAEAHIRKSGAIPTFKGIYGFPATICASVNTEVVHGIPRADCIFKEGDIFTVDVGATYRGLVADAAVTFPVGDVDPATKALLEHTLEALDAAIEKMMPGNYLEDISAAVEDVCIKYGHGLVREYGGHSVGHKLHEEPFIHNHRTGNRGPELKPNMTLAIEPMFTLGSGAVKTLGDDWTVVTADDTMSAHFEHTVLITESGPERLTVLAAV
ncbi:MAG: type I methionyl aminopeptidase [Vampirovibrionales bacterium]|nr:type I methionyl aminopeptidase [Vampirovibrionales bacterium]